MEFGGSDENQEKANSDKDSGNNLTFNASLADASPHWAKNQLMYSMVEVASCPENLDKSYTLNWGGKGTYSNQLGYGFRYKYPCSFGF